MQPLTLQEIIASIDGRPMGAPPTLSISAVGIDSRSVTPGELFFALPGDRFDGHRFVGDALRAGAAAAVIARAGDVPVQYHAAGRLIVVPDTRASLGRLAQYYRDQVAATVIGVVGSNGKTTTKAMIHAVLSANRRGRAAPKSFNNDVGVPLTLLSAEAADEFLVVEIGTNAPGEVAALSRIVRPDIAVLTSLGEEHLEFFGDLAGVADEEVSVFASVRSGGLAVMHVDAAERAAHVGDPRLNRVTIGTTAAADLRAGDVVMTESGLSFRVNERFAYELPMIGPHNAVNALAAIAVGRRLAMEHADIAAALRGFAPPPMRMEILRRGSLTIINDAYNANPTSLHAALATLDAWPGGGRRVLLLGDMHELGRRAEECHAAIGRAAGRSAARLIISIGRHAELVAREATSTAGPDTQIRAYPDRQTAASALSDSIRAGDVILLKGSRAAGMDQMLEALPHLSAPPVAAKKAAARQPRRVVHKAATRGAATKRTLSRTKVRNRSRA